MVIASAQTVGNINWPGLIISVVAFIGSMTVILGYIDRRAEKRQGVTQEAQEQIRGEVRDSIKALGEILTERLETKENVNNLKIEVAKVSEQLRLLLTLNGGHSGAS